MPFLGAKETIRFMNANAQKMSVSEAEQIAIRAIAFITDDTTRLARFLDLTGWTPDALKDDPERTGFLQAVIEHLAGDETLLLTFAANGGVEPALVEYAHQFFEKGRDSWT